MVYVEGGYIVEELRDLKFDSKTKAWLIQVKWAGLKEVEKTWEPAITLLEDVPVMVRAFLMKDGLATAWAIVLGDLNAQAKFFYFKFELS